jgi:S1-C subfamily serine protease
LATALACGVTMLAHRLPEEEGGLSPARASGSRKPFDRFPPVLADGQDEASLRVTPVVKAVRRAADSVVSIYLVDRRTGSADGQGSGVILDENGLVITNRHVVWRATGQGSSYELEARLKNDRKYPLHVISTSDTDDLALLDLKLPPGETVKPIVIGNSSTLMVGETVIAIGNPQGHANTVTVGVLSAMDRSIKVRAPDGRVRSYADLLQTDAAINQGNSGGALLDVTGKLIGINNAMAVSAENIGFAIPANTVKRVFRDVLLSSENLASVWLGMQVTERNGQVLVAKVEPMGPAERAGIRHGDRVLSAAGENVKSPLEYARRVLEAEPGELFPLRLERDGRTVQAQPVPLSQTSFELIRRIGIEVETVAFRDDSDLVRRASLTFYGSYARRVPVLSGVVKVVRVYPDTPGDELRVREGDVLLGYGYPDLWGDYREAPFVSQEDLADKVRVYAGRTIPIMVLRGERVLDGKLEIRG